MNKWKNKIERHTGSETTFRHNRFDAVQREDWRVGYIA